MALEATELDGAIAVSENHAGMAVDEAPPPKWSGRKLRMLLCCAGAPFLITLDTNIVAVSLPAQPPAQSLVLRQTEPAKEPIPALGR